MISVVVTAIWVVHSNITWGQGRGEGGRRRARDNQPPPSAHCTQSINIQWRVNWIYINRRLFSATDDHCQTTVHLSLGGEEKGPSGSGARRSRVSTIYCQTNEPTSNDSHRSSHEFRWHPWWPVTHSSSLEGSTYSVHKGELNISHHHISTLHNRASHHTTVSVNRSHVMKPVRNKATTCIPRNISWTRVSQAYHLIGWYSKLSLVWFISRLFQHITTTKTDGHIFHSMHTDGQRS